PILFTTITNKAMAASTEVKAPIDLLIKAKEAGHNGPLSLLFPESVSNFFDTMNGFLDWCRSLPEHIAEWSVQLMGWLYELCSTLILKTPLWIFDNEWFSNTTYMFSLISLGIVSVLTVIEA